jgi:hypothetical protein
MYKKKVVFIDLKIEPDEKICGFRVYGGKNHQDEHGQPGQQSLLISVSN